MSKYKVIEFKKSYMECSESMCNKPKWKRNKYYWRVHRFEIIV